MFGYTFVQKSGEIARQNLVGTIWGSISVSGLNWVMDAGTREYFIDSKVVTGSGTFSPGVSMDGTYASGGGSSSAWGPLTFSSANRLAVTSQSVVGKWSSVKKDDVGMTVDIDTAGNFKGKTSGATSGVCALTGDIHLTQPTTSKNLYTIRFGAVNAATGDEVACKLSTKNYEGPAAIVQSAAGDFVSNGYFRALTMVTRTDTAATLSVTLRKQ